MKGNIMKNKYNFIDYLKDCLFNTTGGFCTLVAIITIALITIMLSAMKITMYFYKRNPILVTNIIIVIVLAVYIYEIITIIYTIQQDYQKHKRIYYKEHNYEK